MMKNLLQVPTNAKAILLTLLIGVATLTACSDEADYSRSKTLLVFADPDEQEALDVLFCSADGAAGTLYVRTNVECQVTFRTRDEDKNWLTFSKLPYDEALKAQPYFVIAAPMDKGTLEKRTGTLAFVYPDEYLGQFITCNQGYSTRLAEKFDWLNTGTDVPYETTGEKLFETWTEAQRDKGWKAPLLDGNQNTYLYSKRGYLKLGDGEHAMNVQLPDLSKMSSDSITLLSFKAVAYVDVEGNKDASTLSVKVENGGMFRDGKKEFALELSHYNPVDPDLATGMWKECTYTAFLFTDKEEKFTANTKITLSIPEGANRVFIDDVYVYIIDKTRLELVDLEHDALNPKTKK